MVQRCMIAQGLLFTNSKGLGEIPTGSPQMGAPNKCGVDSNNWIADLTQISDFRPRYISETVQDGDIVTTER